MDTRSWAEATFDDLNLVLFGNIVTDTILDGSFYAEHGEIVEISLTTAARYNQWTGKRERSSVTLSRPVTHTEWHSREGMLFEIVERSILNCADYAEAIEMTAPADEPYERASEFAGGVYR